MIEVRFRRSTIEVDRRVGNGGIMMKKLMLIYYNIVAVLTILYLVLTATFDELRESFYYNSGWHVVILNAY